jgi:hypothetical protein
MLPRQPPIRTLNTSCLCSVILSPPVESRSTKPRTSLMVAVAPVTPALAHSVPLARQNSRTRRLEPFAANTRLCAQMDGGENFQMTRREEGLEGAKRVLLERMQESQGHQSLSEIRQELRAIDAEMENLKKAGRRPGPFGSPF